MRRSPVLISAVVGIALSLLTASCSSGGDDPGAGGTSDDADAARAGWVTVASGDGAAELSFDPEALPDDVTADDIAIEARFDDSPDEGLPFAGVSLAPDGLDFSTPAELRIVLGSDLEGLIIAAHQSGDAIEFIHGEFVRSDDRSVSFVTDIDHFSDVTIHNIPGEHSLTLTPPVVEAGEIQSVSVRYDIGETVRLAFRSTLDAPGTGRFVTIAPGLPITFPFGTANWDGPWNPTYAIVLEAGEFLDLRSECVSANQDFVTTGIAAQAPATILDVSETVNFASTVLAESIAGRTSSRATSDLSLTTASAGEEITIIFGASLAIQTTCIARSGASAPDPPPTPSTNSKTNPATTVQAMTYDPIAQRWTVKLGDGAEVLATTSTTKWYNVRITATTASGETFTIDGKYANGEKDGARLILDVPESLTDATITKAEFTDDTTYEIEGEGFEAAGEVISALVDVVVRIDNGDGTNTDLESQGTLN